MDLFSERGEKSVPPRKMGVEKKRPKYPPYYEFGLFLEELPKDHYRLPSVGSLPVMDTLKKEFTGGVSEIFDGRPWERHSVCKDMDKEKGEKIVWLATPPVEALWSRERIIEWADKQRSPVAPNGYRPATHEELYAFDKTHPGSGLIAEIGSYTLLDGLQYVADVWNGADRRVLGGGWVEGGFPAGSRILFVSKWRPDTRSSSAVVVV